MTADEIRTMEHARYGYQDTKAALFEIAAQLAELNESLRSALKSGLPVEISRPGPYEGAYLERLEGK